MSNEAGAAIHIPPNASRILLRWGFDTDRAMVDVARLVSTVNLWLRERTNVLFKIAFPFYTYHFKYRSCQ